MALRSVFTGLFLLVVVQFTFAQQYVINGQVTDVATGQPIPFAVVSLQGKPVGTTADVNGKFVLKTTFLTDSLTASFVGYATQSLLLQKNATQTIDFQLAETATLLREIVVTSGENPAFRIMRKIMEHKKKNNPKKLTAYEYENYTKIEVGLDSLPRRLKKNKALKKLVDGVENLRKVPNENGAMTIPVFISEALSDYYYRTHPQKSREYIKKTKVEGVGVVDGSLVSQFVGGSFQTVNFYQDYLGFFGKDLASPITDNWRLTYSYFLADSLQIGGHYCYEIEFEPKNPRDLAFTGKMWIDKETFALYRIEAAMSKAANINYVRQLSVDQENEPTDEGVWMPESTRIHINIDEVLYGLPGMTLNYYTSSRNIVVNQPKPVEFFSNQLELSENYQEANTDFWEKNRHTPLSEHDQLAYVMVDSVKNVPAVKRYTKILNLLVTGYQPISKNIDWGPYTQLYAYNNIEGHRLAFSMRTNTNFSRKWILSGYLAYGFGDHRFKYSTEARYIIDRQKWAVVGARLINDVEQLAVPTEDFKANSLFTIASRFGRLRMPYYQTAVQAFIQKDIIQGYSQRITLFSRDYNFLFPFAYKSDPEDNDPQHYRKDLSLSGVELEARFSRGEKFIWIDNERVSVGSRRIPVIVFRYTHAWQISQEWVRPYRKFSVRIGQNLRTGMWGRLNYEINATYIPTTAPYPLLENHLGNETIFYNDKAFNLMNFSEFISNRFASLAFTQYFEGLLFNRLPGIKKMDLRLFASGKALAGSLHKGQCQLIPLTDTENQAIFQPRGLDDIPYVEVGYGVDNIFKILKIQAIHRLTHRDSPGAQNFGVKAALHFSF